MIKRKFWIFVVSAVIVLSAFMIYWFYFSKPDSFPADEQLMEEINHVFPEAAVNVIQDTVSIDERHVFVPFISKEDDYGGTYWAWQKHKWKLLAIDTTGEPRLWKVDKKDPSTFRMVWNIHPDDQLEYMKFFLIRERGYHVTEGLETYNPRVQMEKKVALEGKSYGVLPLPNEWVSFMDPFIKVGSARQPSLFFNDLFPEREMFFGWIPYDKSSKQRFPEGSVNGNRYFNGDVDIDFIMILNESDIEQPM